MISSLLKVLGAGLGLWEHKEKTKYFDEMIHLKQEYFDVKNSTPIDDDRLSRIEFRLCLLADAFASKSGVPDLED